MAKAKVSNCGHDENNKYHGGKAGDQTGTEYQVKDWYNYTGGWDTVFRWKDEYAKEADLFASICKAAANNNKIGYDQYERTTYYKQLKAADWKPSKITTACEADCSGSTVANLIAVGYRLNVKALKKLSPDLYTGNLGKALENTGMFKKVSVTSEAYAKKGDINLKAGHHVNVTITSGSKVGSSDSSSTKDTKPAYKVGAIYTTQVELNIRDGAGTNYRIKDPKEWTANARKYDKNANGMLDTGTQVSCKAIKNVGADVWMQIPSGWICAWDGIKFKAYVK